MVRITEELIRKKSEHNECVICTLEELSLHQEDVDKIEHINNWCKDLQILYLQSNLISKIENLNKLKKLQYLNLAINNIERIENLERCESLEKLDLTLNFIGDLESVCSLQNNVHLKQLYLTGNPCTDFEGYRNYVIVKLPQLETLDNIEITRSERIKAQQIIQETERGISKAYKEYQIKRKDQRERLENQKWEEDDEEFWKSRSEHAPETRYEMSRRSRKARNKDAEKQQKQPKPTRSLEKNGRPLNVNEAKIKFNFNDENPEAFLLDLHIYKYLDTNFIQVDVQPYYVKVSIKGKVFQFVLQEEIYTDKSIAQRSQTTGHLLVTMPRVNYKPTAKPIEYPKKETMKTEFLEVTEADESLDFSNIIENKTKKKVSISDNPDVPPLEYI